MEQRPNVQMNEVFESAHEMVMKWEGGFFNHKNDPGGITNYGVSLRFLKALDIIDGDVDGDGDIDVDDILAMTPETAKKIFRRHFWDIPKLDSFRPLTAFGFYDFAVNAGVPRATKILQMSIGFTGKNVDGRIGPKTRARISSFSDYEVAMGMVEQRADWYRHLSSVKPSSRVFLRGWLNRTGDCKANLMKNMKDWYM